MIEWWAAPFVFGAFVVLVYKLAQQYLAWRERRRQRREWQHSQWKPNKRRDV